MKKKISFFFVFLITTMITHPIESTEKDKKKENQKNKENQKDKKTTEPSSTTVFVYDKAGYTIISSKDGQQWELFGGRLESNERSSDDAIAQGAARELYEETAALPLFEPSSFAGSLDVYLDQPETRIFLYATDNSKKLVQLISNGSAKRIKDKDKSYKEKNYWTAIPLQELKAAASDPNGSLQTVKGSLTPVAKRVSAYIFKNHPQF